MGTGGRTPQPAEGYKVGAEPLPKAREQQRLEVQGEAETKHGLVALSDPDSSLVSPPQSHFGEP